MKKLLLGIVAGFLMLFVSGVVNAAAITLTPVDYVYDENAPREIRGDAAPGWGYGSWQGPATGKSNMHLSWDNELTALFGSNHGLAVGDLSEISFYTKSTSNESWWLTIYTKFQNDGLDSGTWYDSRVHAYTGNSGGVWQLNSTDDNLMFNTYPSSGSSYSLLNIGNLLDVTEEILAITFQSNSGWNGFDGQLDGATITLQDGRIGEVDFEPTPEPTTMALFGLGLLGVAGISRRKQA